MRTLLLIPFCLVYVAAWSQIVNGQDEFNYDEAKVPEYLLPNVLTSQDGTNITSAEQWHQLRRPELVRLFQEHVYGVAPGRPQNAQYDVFESDNSALDGKARRRQVKVTLQQDGKQHSFDLLLYLPQSDKPCPVFLGLNFGGNQTVQDDPAIRITEAWIRTDDHRATEDSRGSAASRWPVEQILTRGYGVATVYCGDIDPDFDDGFENGVHSLFPVSGEGPADAWGTIAGWAWGLSRAVDYLTSNTEINADRIMVMGHSRLGKTALWAGAIDQRFALVISNNSGCGGAAISRRRFGETVKRINTSFPHWFNDNYLQYNDNEDACPVDQHMLVALMAPRPVLICSAQEDRWADPKGEMLAGVHATPAYELLGFEGLDRTELPELNSLVGDRIGYNIRPGKHDVMLSDWEVYCDFADKHFGKP
ncbi:MAG: acetylxylan esterase [Planctomycetales bacterium]|nr:acetylxylan esterase [Planctomycetales bacterium]